MKGISPGWGEIQREKSRDPFCQWALYTTLVYDQGHLPAFPINPDHHWPLTSHIALMIWPLISDAAGVALTPSWLGESPKNMGAEFGLEGVESEEVFMLLSEEVEILEQPSEGVLGERLEWKECVVALGPAGRDSE